MGFFLWVLLFVSQESNEIKEYIYIYIFFFFQFLIKKYLILLQKYQIRLIILKMVSWIVELTFNLTIEIDGMIYLKVK
jgi:hypothetical protein